ncbi:methionyl-tRNA formyltransferase [Chloroflexota bacterium]
MRIIFLGTPGFAVPALLQLAGGPLSPAAVYTRPDRPAGRGRAVAAPPVKEAALELGLTVLQPDSLKTQEALEGLHDLAPEVIVVAAYGQLLPPAVLALPRFGCVNIHPSLLPKYRGAAPIPAAVLAGDDFTGVSLMLLDEGMDTGPIISQAAVSISPQDNTGTLTQKLARVAAALLGEVLPRYLRGEVAPRPQDEARATGSATIRHEDGAIDWASPATAIWLKVRAYYPWPGCYTNWRGRQLKILEAYPLAATKVLPGQVVATDGQSGGLGIGTGEGVLGILRLQMAGRRPMGAREFLRGQPGLLGEVLPS